MGAFCIEICKKDGQTVRFNYIIDIDCFVFGGDRMIGNDIDFSNVENEKLLIVKLPNRLVFDVHFLIQMDYLVKRAIDINRINTVRVVCPEIINYDNMCKAYIINVLTYINKFPNKRVYINSIFKSRIQNQVITKEGKDFNKDSDLDELIRNQELEYYMFNGKEDTSGAINHVSSLLVNSMFSFNPDKLKDFLNTTIGEIFSNSRNHIDQQEVFFASFVDLFINGDIFLTVSIIDYGKTIVNNVREYLDKESISGAECIDWAIKPANTTRTGSGGYGLPTLIDYMKAAKGDLYIFSGDDFYLLLNGESERTFDVQDGVFLGTSVAFKVKLNQNSFIINYDDENRKIDSISLSDI